ncbi:MAG: RnfABCDGE type electron transport complex subunit D, partial [Clostridia bacterium]|nr:RnfABCDGE type electron transport complex subunit D [Clostridia bacterium]
MERKLIVSSSPHIYQTDSIQTIMLDVIIALIPATMMGIYYFGYRAALVVLTAIAAAVGAEYFYRLLLKKTSTTSDLSAVVTGLLLGLNLPVTIPLWMVVIGSVFAIVIVKQLYGGLGKNFMNPALAARCFMLIAWAGAMTTFTEPFAGYGADAVSQATPLAVLKGTSEGVLPTLSDAFFGMKAGSIGETSGAILLLGGIYLLYRRVISWHIPVVYI